VARGDRRAGRDGLEESICTILPGYQPLKARESLKDRQREAREDWVLMRVATVVLTLVVVAFVVIMLVIIATHS
jgi:hypothetical protein